MTDDEQRRVFSVVGTLPEPGGYAVAKFSRSARPYQEWIRELTQEGASRFYEQFYFSYGHASIADLAHLTMVAENISIVAAIEVLDEQLVDAQESSTRYQDFRRRRYFTPPEIRDTPLVAEYAETCDGLFTTYHALHQAVARYYAARYADQRPPDLPDDEYQRTLRARAFDVARYLLPSSTLTGLGYLCSARTLERQISRLSSHPLAEVHGIAEDLRRAATEPAFNPLSLGIEPELEAFATAHPGPETETLLAEVRKATLAGAAAAPTLVRHTEPRPYLSATYEAARAAAAPLLASIQPDGTRGVTLGAPVEPPIELAGTLLYRVSDASYQQILERLRGHDEGRGGPHPNPSPNVGGGARGEGQHPAPSTQHPLDWLQGRQGLPPIDGQLIESIAQLAATQRGPHDEPVREARVGYQLVFDLCLDQGAFRDLHRHRNCVQIIKDFSSACGYDLPNTVIEVGMETEYRAAMERAGRLATKLDAHKPGLGQYALPLAYRRRALFKMDAAELGYIAEQRTTPAGHFSYREIAYQMFLAFQERYPGLARSIRVTDPAIEDFFER